MLDDLQTMADLEVSFMLGDLRLFGTTIKFLFTFDDAVRVVSIATYRQDERWQRNFTLGVRDHVDHRPGSTA